MSQSSDEDLFELIDGIRWGREWGITNLRYALSYQAKADDLFIVTYPRSGTTWMQNIVYNLLNNGKSFDTDRDHFFEQNPHLEIDGEVGLTCLQRPGAIKTHLPINRVPYHPQAKYICVVRNPKDVCISYFIFYNTWGDVPKLDFDRFFEYFIQGRLLFNDYFEGLRLMWQRRQEKNILFLRYEEMQTDLPVVITKIADFINVHLTDDLLKCVLEYSSFEYMKNRFDSERRLFEAEIIEQIDDENDAERRREIFRAEQNIEVVRQGKINGWKSQLTAEQNERIYARFLEICADCEGLKEFWSSWNVFS